MSEKWREYYERTKSLPPHSATAQSVVFIEEKRALVGIRALDLGCGAGRDARFLLGKGMVVTAVDADSNGLESLKDEFPKDQLTTAHARYDEFVFGEYDFVTSQFALSFNPPETFHDVIRSVKDSLVQGGYLSVNIFGNRDGWSCNTRMTFLNENEVRSIFEDMTVVKFEETEKDASLADGSLKHWHYFDVFATK